ncbi:MAG: hypothetical protein AAFU85_34330, partial [Planctomycetota bacterium]
FECAPLFLTKTTDRAVSRNGALLDAYLSAVQASNRVFPHHGSSQSTAPVFVSGKRPLSSLSLARARRRAGKTQRADPSSMLF